MNQLQLNHHGKLKSTERPFHPNVELVSSEHPLFCSRDSNPGFISLNFN